MKSGHLLLIWFGTVTCILSMSAILCIQVDPFFHYHPPYTNTYYYPLNNERSQNDGILKHFEYTGIITGTSMTENFKSSEADRLWGGYFVKTPISGGTYREINDLVRTGLENNPNICVVIRGLDMWGLASEKDAIREDVLDYPAYLFDRNYLNDVRYLWNHDVIYDRVIPAVLDSRVWAPERKGIEPFDSYANWDRMVSYGRDEVLNNSDLSGDDTLIEAEMTEIDRGRELENIYQNVTSIADQYPNVDFIYFFTPCSVVWWGELRESGMLRMQVDEERIAIEEMLTHPNIKLFSFNTDYSITVNLDNYKDPRHYSGSINEQILEYMYYDQYRIDEGNYRDYLDEEYQYYAGFDYESL